MIAYYISLPFLYCISILPFPALYFVSDLLFPVIYYLVGYRKKVVMDNLLNAFPDKTPQERNRIARKFYRHFTDLIFEILKMKTIPPGSLSRRIRYANPGLLQDYFERGKGFIGMLAHYNNWEWTVAVSHGSPHKAMAVYKPLQNRYFDRFMKNARERHGTELIPMRETLRRVLGDHKNGILAGYGLISDQSPVWEEIQYWSPFMNQLTPFFTGTEKLARKAGLPVVYYSMQKVKRGHYIIDLIPICDDPAATGKHEITEKFIRTLEKVIAEKPEYWLWTHRRWKLTPKKLTELDHGGTG
jgi:KDO2-lipid IV(A) lauroyltransferase